MLDFGLATADEICSELGSRLRAVRLSLNLQQADVAAKAGVSRGTVSTLENKGQSTLASFIRIVYALGLEDQLQELFILKAHSIAEMEHNERAKRKRAPRHPKQSSV
ncbi:helix-turn-helix domain-containing protein [Ramlibacter alkalitolerans]|uniref:Helix-turn-helix domain-containing protein n=2 Tax=Ramlibacter alkalitolerans TaxID=2039631 RepID=A0ABS1JWB5_9BURK|nr:helix-turn-helix domain-containing protein [Ramlibacter alkalitolerans]MBL0427830.1 helix-turn-helix domain-containing protein [Ramlibacter alkalitolerans]